MINNHILWNSLFLSLTVTLTGNCCCCAFSIINYNLQKSHIDNSCDVKLATLLGLFNNNSLGQKQQEVKVIWCKAVSLPYMDSSIVFARLRQCDPPSSTLQSVLSAPYRCCPLLSCFEYIDRWRWCRCHNWKKQVCFTLAAWVYMLRLLSRYIQRLPTDSTGCRISVPMTTVLLDCDRQCSNDA